MNAKNWKEFKKNNLNDYNKCCNKIYLKCSCVEKIKNKIFKLEQEA